MVVFSTAPTQPAGEKDGQKVLDPEAICSLNRLLYVAQPVSKGLLQRIMLSLAANPLSRIHIVAILIECLPKRACKQKKPQIQ